MHWIKLRIESNRIVSLWIRIKFESLPSPIDSGLLSLFFFHWVSCLFGLWFKGEVNIRAWCFLRSSQGSRQHLLWPAGKAARVGSLPTSPWDPFSFFLLMSLSVRLLTNAQNIFHPKWHFKDLRESLSQSDTRRECLRAFDWIHQYRLFFFCGSI